MNILKGLLEDTAFFQVISSSSLNPENTAQVCIGRTLDSRLWVGFVQDLLRVEAKFIEQGLLKENVLHISKFYYLSDLGQLIFMWKVICNDVAWLSKSIPKTEKAEWAKDFKVELDSEGRPTSVTLVSTPSPPNLPSPGDISPSGAEIIAVSEK